MPVKSDKKEKVIFILVLLIFIFIGWRLVKSKDNKIVLNKQNNIKESVEDSNEKILSGKNSDEKTAEDANNLEKIFIHIDGEVNKPGLYECTKGQRIQDVVDMAGGLTENANTLPINFSQKLNDEMKIVIPTKQSEDHSDTGNSSNDAGSNQNDYVWDGENDEFNRKPNSNILSKVNINKATVDELMTLPSIGEKKAKLIVEYREKTGFKEPEDIMNVSGIGEKIFEAIKDFIVVE